MNQAQRLVEKFGGPARLSALLKTLPDPAMHRERLAIYRWMWSRERGGRGGRIPQSVWPGLLQIARQHGLYLSDADISPRETRHEEIDHDEGHLVV